MRLTLSALCMLIAAACGSVEGPLLHRIGAPDGSSSMDAGRDAAAAGLPIAQDAKWQYQLAGTPDLNVDAKLFVLDLFDLDAPSIVELHARGKVVIAYLSAGTRESFRTDAANFPQPAVGATHPSYPQEAWLDIRDAGVRTVMAARLSLAHDKGFDGVLPTNLSGYVHNTGFNLSATDQRAYAEWLAAQAHARGLYTGLTDFELAPGLAPQFDFAIHFACIESSNCAELDAFSNQGKPVFDVETAGDAATVCAAAAAQGLNVLIKRPQFDAYRMVCP